MTQYTDDLQEAILKKKHSLARAGLEANELSIFSSSLFASLGSIFRSVPVTGISKVRCMYCPTPFLIPFEETCCRAVSAPEYSSWVNLGALGPCT